MKKLRLWPFGYSSYPTKDLMGLCLIPELEIGYANQTTELTLSIRFGWIFWFGSLHLTIQK